MSSPKVLMFGWEYAPFISGGLGVATRSIVNSLKNQGMDIIFVLPKMPYELTDEQIRIVNASKIKIETKSHTIFTKLEIESLLRPYEGTEEFKKRMVQMIKNQNGVIEIDESNKSMYGTDLIKEVERYANRAREIAAKNQHDVIHTHDWMTCSAGVEARKTSGKPMVMHVHATEFDRTGGNPNQQIYDIERHGMDNANKIIAVSEFTKQKIMQYYGVPADKIVVVHNSIEKVDGGNRLATNINQTDKVVLYIGRLTMQKGVKFLLEAAEKVLRHKKRVKFVIVGDGDNLQYLVHKAIELGIEKKVMFAGWLKHSEIDKAYQMADLFVMPSVSEPFGLTPLEAIRNGVPVLISKQSGVAEVVSNSLKVDFWDTDEMANKILSVIRYEPLAKFMSRNAEEELMRMSWAKQTEKIIDLYNTII